MNSSDSFYFHYLNCLSLKSPGAERLFFNGIDPAEIYGIKSVSDFKEILSRAGEEEKRILSFIYKDIFSVKDRAESTWDTALKKGINVISITDKAYPKRLKRLKNPPLVLYYLGSLPDENRKAVSVIGSRRASEYGKANAIRFTEELSKKGISIISGMAYGIDTCANQTAVKYKGLSFGVLGSGADWIYPAENEKLYRKLIENGGIISEYPCGTEPRPQNFPRRNRIIAGLSDTTLVIEAALRSGSLITVGYSLEIGNDVYAVPGRNTDIFSEGCNRLIKDGAYMAETPADIDL